MVMYLWKNGWVVVSVRAMRVSFRRMMKPVIKRSVKMDQFLMPGRLTYNESSVDLPGLSLKNPIMPASGCFGFGREYSQFYDLSELGAVIMKAATQNERLGNPTPRVADTAGGMLNAIGLQNPGVHNIIESEVPFLAKYDTNIIANISGSSPEEYVYVAEAFNQTDQVNALELN